MLVIMCNAVEAMRLRHILLDAIIQRETLLKIFQDQNKIMSKESKTKFNDPFNFSTFLSGGGNSTAPWKNFVDSGPGLTTTVPTTYSIKEFDPSLTTCLNFTDPEAFKAMICPLGLEELRVAVRYELVNLFLLIVAVRTNQVMLDNGQRMLSEMDLLCKGYSVSNPVNEV